MNQSTVLIGIITTQIICESFPISSNGHMRLVQRLADVFGNLHMPQLPEFFEPLLYGPTILILMLFFWRSWFGIVKIFFIKLGNVITSGVQRGSLQSDRLFWTVFFKIMGLVVVADSVTVGCYFIKKYWLHDAAWLHSDWMLFGTFAVTACLLVMTKFIPRMTSYRTSRISFPLAILLGGLQGLCLITGLSRFASTYVLTRLFGVPHRRAFQFSFLILFPLILADFVVHGVYDVLAAGVAHEVLNMPMMVTMLVACVPAYIAFMCAEKLAARDKLWLFGLYMIIPLGATVMLLVC